MRVLGISPAEAAALGSGKRHWMCAIEVAEGDSVEKILREAARVAHITGYSLLDHADEWGVHHNTLRYWNDKWGIRWPRFKRKKS